MTTAATEELLAAETVDLLHGLMAVIYLSAVPKPMVKLPPMPAPRKPARRSKR